MRNVSAYPADTATGACLITRKSKVRPGDTIIDLQSDLESLPAFGRLCIHEDGVRLLITQLGWKLPDDKMEEELATLVTQNAQLRSELADLREALVSVLKAADLVGVEISDDITELVDA